LYRERLFRRDLTAPGLGICPWELLELGSGNPPEEWNSTGGMEFHRELPELARGNPPEEWNSARKYWLLDIAGHRHPEN
jgi:hypothetical protein